MKIRLCIFFVLLLVLSLVSAQAQKEEGDSVYNPKSMWNVKPLEVPKDLKKKLVVSNEEKNEYKRVTGGSNGKIAKIWNHPCEFEKVIDASDDFCLSQLELAIGSVYRFNRYPRDKVIPYISIIKDEFRAESPAGNLQFLIDLGEIELGNITKQTAEVETLFAVPVYTDDDAVNPQDLKQGIDYKNLKISDRRPIILNHTYLFRSMNVDHLPFQFFVRTDWRYESIFAFRVVKSEDSIVTIVWKEVQYKMKQQKDSKDTDDAEKKIVKSEKLDK